MKRVLALYGSGEFTPKMSEVDGFLLKQHPYPKIAIFPTAAGRETTWKKWIEKGEKHYKSLGVTDTKGYPVIDKKSANDKSLINEIESFNIFVFSGGDPGYLYRILSESFLWEIIKVKYDNGAYIIGSSAGAMVMGEKFWSNVYEFDKTGKIVPWVDGFKMVKFGVLPHFNVTQDYFGPERFKKAASNYPKRIDLVGIDEDTAYLNIKGEWVVKGRGKVQIFQNM